MLTDLGVPVKDGDDVGKVGGGLAVDDHAADQQSLILRDLNQTMRVNLSRHQILVHLVLLVKGVKINLHYNLHITQTMVTTVSIINKAFSYNFCISNQSILMEFLVVFVISNFCNIS